MKISISQDHRVTKNSELAVEAVMTKLNFYKGNYFKVPGAKDSKQWLGIIKNQNHRFQTLIFLCLYVV